MRGLRAYLVVISIACAALAAPRARADSNASATLDSSAQDSALKHWWFGGYYRHLWVPPFILNAFLARAPGVSNDGFGGVVTYRTGGALNVEMGFGYMPYAFHGPFVGKTGEDTDTELVNSDLGFYHLTGSLLWQIEFHRVVALELGLGIDLGIFSGHVTRNEAYFDPQTKQFLDCKGPHMPDIMGANGQLYCADPENGSMKTDPPDAKGEQYHVRDNHVPPVMAFPMLPRIGLRIQPIEYVALKAEFAFGIAQMWVGASLHVNFGWAAPAHHAEPEPEAAPVPPPPVPVAVSGRVLGRVVDAASNTAVAGATVRLKAARALSPLTTELDGRFMVDRLDAGHVRFEVEHPDYEPGACEAEIPKQGGDVPLDCHLTAKPQLGAISGQLHSEDGKEIASASVQLLGPRNDKLSSDEHGLFAAVDLPPGAYRIHVEADGYFVQVVEVQVDAHQTAMPQIILIKQPKQSLVQLRKEEIVIREQIQFLVKSAELLPESERVLRQVADVILRNPQIESLEIQGHTDSQGGREMNMQLSQARAESVRAWLIKAGVTPERLEAKGYGPDHPLRPNNNAKNRAQNRRVQFMFRQPAAAQ